MYAASDEFYPNVRELRKDKKLAIDQSSDYDREKLLGEDSEDTASLVISEASSAVFATKAHILMGLLLIFIIALFVKNFLVNDPDAYNSYSYFYAFGLPGTLVTLGLGEVTYAKYVKPFEIYKKPIFGRLAMTLLICTISIVLAIIFISLYMSSPKNLEYLGFAAMVPYYLAWALISGSFCFFFPGLFNRFSKHLVIMGAVYLLLAFAYPLLLMGAISASPESKSKMLQIYSTNAAFVVCVPILVALGLHLLGLITTYFFCYPC
jgi:hypothetical protein